MNPALIAARLWIGHVVLSITILPAIGPNLHGLFK
jgi:hypothetical protein